MMLSSRGGRVLMMLSSRGGRVLMMLSSLTGPNIHPLPCSLWPPPPEHEALIGKCCCAPPCQLHRHSLAYLRLFCRRSMGTLLSMPPLKCMTLKKSHLPHRKHEGPLPRKSRGLMPRNEITCHGLERGDSKSKG
jgi:hypothetical protein